MPSACRFTVRTLETSAPVSTLRFLRCSAGRRKAWLALQRRPRRWFIWK